MKIGGEGQGAEGHAADQPAGDDIRICGSRAVVRSQYVLLGALEGRGVTGEPTVK